MGSPRLFTPVLLHRTFTLHLFVLGHWKVRQGLSPWACTVIEPVKHNSTRHIRPRQTSFIEGESLVKLAGTTGARRTGAPHHEQVKEVYPD